VIVKSFQRHDNPTTLLLLNTSENIWSKLEMALPKHMENFVTAMQQVYQFPMTVDEK